MLQTACLAMVSYKAKAGENRGSSASAFSAPCLVARSCGVRSPRFPEHGCRLLRTWAPARAGAGADKLLKGEFHEIKGIMQKSRELGMKTFDHSLFELYNSLETEAAAPEATA